MRLHLHEWGPSDGPRVVCLHGVRNQGGHFAELAQRLPAHRVLAPDLLGHGFSPWEPPWSIAAHCDAIVRTVGAEPAALVGHSFGGRLAYELAARAPKLIPKLVLLDPAILLPGHVALTAAENARPEKAYVSFDELIARRYDESQLQSAPRELVVAELRGHVTVGDDGLTRYRYCQSAVVAAYGEMASQPTPFAQVRVPTLLVLGEASYLPYDHLLDAHRAALGDQLEVLVVPGGHTVLWDALEETAAAIAAFIGLPAAPSGDARGVTLREEPVVAQARLRDGREIDVRVVVPDDSYVERSQIDTVVVELEVDGEPLGVVATPLEPEDADRARALAQAIREGLERGELEPTAEGIEAAALGA